MNLADNATYNLFTLVIASSALLVSIVALIRSWHKPKPRLKIKSGHWKTVPAPTDGPYYAYFIDIVNVGNGPAMDVTFEMLSPLLKNSDVTKIATVSTFWNINGTIHENHIAKLDCGEMIRLPVRFYEQPFGINPISRHIPFITKGVFLIGSYTYAPHLNKKRKIKINIDKEIVGKIIPG